MKNPTVTMLATIEENKALLSNEASKLQPYVKAEDFPEKEMKDVSFYNKE